MKQESSETRITRRTFIKGSVAAATYYSFFHTSGCATFPKPDMPDINYTRDLILTNGRIVDVISGNILEDKSIIIRNGHIYSIEDHLKLPKNAQAVDLGNRYIIPGLIDAHCHTTLPSVGGFTLSTAAAILNQLERNYEQHIISGTTTVRDTSSFVKFLGRYVRKINSGKLIGPRVIHPGTWMNISGSHPGDIPPSAVSPLAPLALKFMGNLSADFKDTQELKERMARNLETGPSFIKLTLDEESVLCGKPGKNQVYADEHIREIVKFSEKHDLPIAAHVHYKFGFDRAQEIPISHLEHMVGDVLLSDKDVLKMAENNMTVVPTMILGQMYAAEELFDQMPKEYQTDFVVNEISIWKDFFNSMPERYCLPTLHKVQKAYKKYYTTYPCSEMFKNKIFAVKAGIYYGILVNGVKSLQKMREAGILIGCGTDAGVPFSCHGTLWREMSLYSRIGFRNDEILRCATINNARILRMEHKIGSIETNKFADLVVLSDNPLENIEAVRDPMIVFKEGKLLHSHQDLRQEKNIISLT